MSCNLVNNGGYIDLYTMFIFSCIYTSYFMPFVYVLHAASNILRYSYALDIIILV